jgi:thiamine-phosphate pyrophosphorylase
VQNLLLREKELAEGERRDLAHEVARASAAAGIALWISEDAGLAREVGARGVQLSERCRDARWYRDRYGADLGLGVSLHREIRRTSAELEVCDHAFLSPLFATPGKPEVEPLGIPGFLERAARIPLPVYALGGITRDRVAELVAAGISRLAGIRLFFAAESGDSPRSSRGAQR